MSGLFLYTSMSRCDWFRSYRFNIKRPYSTKLFPFVNKHQIHKKYLCPSLQFRQVSKTETPHTIYLGTTYNIQQKTSLIYKTSVLSSLLFQTMLLVGRKSFFANRSSFSYLLSKSFLYRTFQRVKQNLWPIFCMLFCIANYDASIVLTEIYFDSVAIFIVEHL